MRTVSTTATPGAVNHVLHLLLTVFTCGLWLPIWIVLTIAGATSSGHTYTVTEPAPVFWPAGWYPIPGGRQAWWDGQCWTGHTR